MKNTSIYIFLIFSFFAANALAQSYTIYPIPQKMTETNQRITITSTVNVVSETGVSEVVNQRLKEVLDRAGLTFVKSSSFATDKTNILLGIKGSSGVADTYATEHAVAKTVFEPSSNKFDAHILQINENHPNGDILILGNEAGSAYYALATLEQMLEQRTNGQLHSATVEDFAFTEYRGIVEGFYGRPYTVDNRLSLLEFCKRYKMNVYVYGPKSDPYHLGKWRQDYPKTLTDRERYFGLITQDDIRAITAKAQQCHVNFVWAAHPAMESGISFTTSGIDQGVKDIMSKFNHMYDLGVRGFGIFIDDMNYTPSGEMQAYLADQAQKALMAKFNGAGVVDKDKVSPLFFVPTAYALNYGASYTLNSLKTVDKDVVIAFTGYDCFSNIRGSACQDMANRVGRNAVMWWNNPVNDDHDDRIYMREMTCHWTIEDKNPIPTLHGLIMNPMSQGQASKVALFGSADYSWNPAKFNTKTNWEAFFTSTIVDNEELSNALKTFAVNSNSLIEEESLRKLYTDFKSGYSEENLPAVADELQQEMQKINDACRILETLKDSENEEDRLLHEDIRCWVAKLKSMTDMIRKSLALMKSGGTLSEWTYYSDIQSEYKKLHKDSSFLVSAFEGAGTSTYEKYYEVHPSQTYMEPFVDYIVGKLGDYSPQLPEKSKELEVITNKENLSASIVIATDADKVKLVGIQGLSLASKEYVGMHLNSIRNATVSMLELGESQLELQHSITGKDWTAFTADGETAIDMAYVRIKNLGDAEVVINEEELSVSFPSSENTSAEVATTNMRTYSTYNIRNVIDGNEKTYFWKDGPQAVGDYVTLDYGKIAPRYDVNLLFNSGDRPSGEVRIELSEDHVNWEPIATFTSADLSGNHRYTCKANGKQARYIRLWTVSVSGGDWFQLAEFSATGIRAVSIAHDHNGNPISGLDDRNLTTSYKPTEEGYLIYQFIENLKINKISLFHHSEFTSSSPNPLIFILSDGQWVKKGTLKDACTVIDVSDLKDIAQLKVQWNKVNQPEIYEILPEGEPYVEKEEPGTSVNHRAGKGVTISYADAGTYLIEADDLISEVIVYDSFGRKIEHQSVNGLTASLQLEKKQSLHLVKVVLANKVTVTRKILY